MAEPIIKLPFAQPDDWHHHFRDGAALKRTVCDAAGQFGRVVAMPNLAVPITTVRRAMAYRKRLLAACPKNYIGQFQPLMALYLTDDTSVADVRMAAANMGADGDIIGFKLYPQNATTASHYGVSNLQALAPVLAAMEEAGVPLLVHAEVTDSTVDVFDREAVFIDSWLVPWRAKYPQLPIVLEHVSTACGVSFVCDQKTEYTAATITPQHLRYNRNDLLAGQLKPDLYCLPILKARADQEAIIEAATSGNSQFFIGTDSAPHSKNQKYCASGCAGVYNTPTALAIYAETFERHKALDCLMDFCCHFGADFYGLARPAKGTHLMCKYETEKPSAARSAISADGMLDFGNSKVQVLAATENLAWQLESTG